MLKKLTRQWQGRRSAKKPRQEPAQDKTRMACCALLLRAAQIDGEVSQEERDCLLRLMRGAFSLQEAEARELFAEADREAEEASDLFGWTAAINRDMKEEEKRDLIAHLWKVVYADGHCDDFESNLMRRLAGLLHIPDRVSAEIRRAVLPRES